jgi:hypothetical protein
LPIHLKVEAELDQSSARNAAQQVQSHFRNASRDIGSDLSKGLKAGIDDAVRGMASQFGALGNTAQSARHPSRMTGQCLSVVGYLVS